MQTYELTYIISSHMTSEEAETVKKDFEAFLQANGGMIVKSEKSAPQPLAYQIKKHSSGFFVVTELQMEESKIKELRAELEKNTKILRHFLIVKHPAKIMKARRTRKPMPIEGKPEAVSVLKHPEKKTKAAKVEMEDINKKLDEILSE